MASVRKQTATFVLRCEKPVSPLEFWGFLKKQWNVKLEELVMVQPETSGKKIHVKFVSEKRAEEVAEASEVALELTDGTPCSVFVQGPGQGVKTVKVRNLPMEVSSKDVEMCLGQFGKVLQCRDERYPRGSCYEGLLSGNRLVKMVMLRPVPSFLRVAGVEAVCYYAGQKPTCYVCNQDDHMRVNCPNRRRPPSWAERAAGRKGGEDRDVEEDGGPSSPGPSRDPSPAPRTPSPRRASAPELRKAEDDEEVELWCTPGTAQQQQTTRAEAEQGVAPTQGEPQHGVVPTAEDGDGVSTLGGRSRAESLTSSVSTASAFELMGDFSDAEEALDNSQGRARTESVGSDKVKRKRTEDKFEGQLAKLRSMVNTKHMAGPVVRTRSLEKKAKIDTNNGKGKGKAGESTKNGCKTVVL